MEPIYSTNIIYNEYPEPTTGPTYTGSHDSAFLQTIGFDETDLTELNKTVTWNEEDDYLHLLTEEQKQLSLDVDFSGTKGNKNYYWDSRHNLNNLRYVGTNAGPIKSRDFFYTSTENKSFSAIEALKLDWSEFPEGKTMSNMFNYMYSLKYCYFPDTFKPTSCLWTFRNCTSLKSTPNINTENCGTLQGMYLRCTSLKEAKNINLKSATSTSSMFSEAYALKEVEIIQNPINNCNMSGMFENCASLEKITNLDLSKNTNYYNLFYNCYNLKEVPTIVVNQNMQFGNTFQRCYNLEEITFVYPTNKAITLLNSTFYACQNLKKINNLRIQGHYIVNNAFDACYSLKEIDIYFIDEAGTNNYNISQVFNSCYRLQTINLHMVAQNSYSVGGTSVLAFKCYNVETINILDGALQITGTSYCFHTLQGLKKVNGEINILDGGGTLTLSDCFELKEIRMKLFGASNAEATVDFTSSGYISKESILYLIENARNTTYAATIKVKAAVKTTLDADADIQAALALKPNITITT